MHYLLEHCPPNPTLEYAQSIVEKIPKGCKLLISQGGGSTIDVGKWVAKTLGLKHLVIPTTAGTGSEVTRYCVLTVDGTKRTFTHDQYLPDDYILQPSLVTTLPPLHTLASGLDALSQAVEALWSKNATPESKNYSIVAIQLIQKSLHRTITHPLDTRARMDMLIAANLSGRAINITKTNVCHAISYPLTDLYDIPHGIACAMSLRYFAEKMNMMYIVDFLLSINLPRYEFDKEKVADIAIKSEKLLDYPLPLTRDDILLSLHL